MRGNPQFGLWLNLDLFLLEKLPRVLQMPPPSTPHFANLSNLPQAATARSQGRRPCARSMRSSPWRRRLEPLKVHRGLGEIPKSGIHFLAWADPSHQRALSGPAGEPEKPRAGGRPKVFWFEVSENLVCWHTLEEQPYACKPLGFGHHSV